MPVAAYADELTAAFRRLCVETADATAEPVANRAAAFRRLCVETVNGVYGDSPDVQPPSGGCVLKLHSTNNRKRTFSSRLQAAVC